MLSLHMHQCTVQMVDIHQNHQCMHITAVHHPSVPLGSWNGRSEGSQPSAAPPSASEGWPCAIRQRGAIVWQDLWECHPLTAVTRYKGATIHEIRQATQHSATRHTCIMIPHMQLPRIHARTHRGCSQRHVGVEQLPEQRLCTLHPGKEGWRVGPPLSAPCPATPATRSLLAASDVESGATRALGPIAVAASCCKCRRAWQLPGSCPVFQVVPCRLRRYLQRCLQLPISFALACRLLGTGCRACSSRPSPERKLPQGPLSGPRFHARCLHGCRQLAASR
jgi:hypothetical protein